jgi:hypothetical protein
MRWFDGGGVEPPKGMRAIGVSGLLLAVLALAALETWVEHTMRRGQPEVAAELSALSSRLSRGLSRSTR